MASFVTFLFVFWRVRLEADRTGACGAGESSTKTKAIRHPPHSKVVYRILPAVIFDEIIQGK